MVLDSLRPTTSGGRHPAFLCLRSFDDAKVQLFSCGSKFRGPIWPDFQHKMPQFLRAVISRPVCRNFRADDITFRS